MVEPLHLVLEPSSMADLLHVDEMGESWCQYLLHYYLPYHFSHCRLSMPNWLVSWRLWLCPWLCSCGCTWQCVPAHIRRSSCIISLYAGRSTGHTGLIALYLKKFQVFFAFSSQNYSFHITSWTKSLILSKYISWK